VDGLSKSQQAYQWIKARIADHEFTPGYRLVLGTIANELDMSVVPVREAIRQLEAEGLVTFERNVGAHVSMVDDSQYRSSMQALSILEGAATALSARRLTPDDVRAAREINQRMIARLEDFDPRAFTALNQQFHAALFAKCANPRMLELVEGEWGVWGTSATRPSPSSPAAPRSRCASTRTSWSSSRPARRWARSRRRPAVTARRPSTPT